MQAMLLRAQLIVAETEPIGVGTVVYFDPAVSAWKSALAAAVADEAGITLLSKSFCAGIVVRVAGAETVDILYGGKYSLASASLKIQDGETFRQGPYWLSATQTGYMTSVKPDVAVYVGSFFTDHCIVNIQQRDMAEAHTHSAIALFAEPAGDLDVDGNLEGYFPDAKADCDHTLVLAGSYRGTPYEYVISATVANDGAISLTWTSDNPEDPGGDLQGPDALTGIYSLGTTGVKVWLHDRGTGTALATSDAWTLNLPGDGQGWSLRDPDFASEVPTAAFEYNIGFHDALNQIYPPIPLRASALMLNGVELSSEDLYPDADNTEYASTMRTIYWRNDDVNYRPWPASEAPEDAKQLVFRMTKAAGSSGFVTSVRPSANSPVKLYAAGTTTPATTGDLEINIDLVLGTSGSVSGYQVVKESSGNQLLRGPVVEKIKAGQGIVITQEDGHPNGQGIVTIATSEAGYAGSFDVVSLENAKQDKIGLFPFVKILSHGSGIASAFTATFQVPYTMPAGLYRAIVYGTVFGTQAIASDVRYAGLNFTYSVLPDYFLDDTADPDTTDLLTAGTANTVTGLVEVPIGAAGEAYTAYDPVLIHNDANLENTNLLAVRVLGDAFPDAGLRRGYTVAIKFAGAAVSSGLSGSEYAGDLGFLNLRWKLVPVTLIGD